MKKIYLPLGLLLASATAILAQSLVNLTPMDTGYVQNTIKISPVLQASVVFEAGTHIVKQMRDGDATKRVDLAPREHDWLWYTPSATAPNEKGKLIMNHERSTLRAERPLLGEGGSMSIVDVIKDGGAWKIDASGLMKDTSVSVDFSTVGWTTINCGGAYLPNGLMMTGEEIFDTYRSKKALQYKTAAGVEVTLHDTLQNKYGYDGEGMYTIPANITQFGGRKIPMHQNFGYMTQIDPSTGKALNKAYHMGRYSHESGTVLSDGKSMILTDDYTNSGGILFKFVSDTTYVTDKDKYYSGNLYAFKQNPSSYAGTWVMIERNLDSLVIARGVASRKGATIFARLEWADVDPITGNVYIAETGMDNKAVKSAPSASNTEIRNAAYLDNGATVPFHWTNSTTDSIYWDDVNKRIDLPFGAVLVLKDALTESPKVEPYLKGGYSTDGTKSFASVDGISIKQFGTKSVAIFQEDVIGRNRGRVKANYSKMIRPDSSTTTYPYPMCEAFLMDLSIANPTVDDLKLFFTTSRGAEVTGAVFSPDGSTIFLQNQHPEEDKTNNPMYAKSATIALTANTATAIDDILSGKISGISIFPNPTQGMVTFNKVVSGSLFNGNGVFIKNIHNTTTLDMTDLNSCVYYFKSTTNEVSKIIVK